MYVFGVKQNYCLTLIIDNNFIATYSDQHNSSPCNAQSSTKIMGIEILLGWSPSTWVVYVKVYLLLKVSCAIIYVHPFPLLATLAFHTNWPLNPSVNLQILLTGLHTVLVVLVQRTSFYWHLHYSCLVINSLILITWLKHCYCREMLVTGASRVNVHVSFCDNYLIESFCVLGEWIPRGGGYSTKFYLGRLHPKVQPPTLLYTIFDWKGPLSYTLHWKMVSSFTYLIKNTASLSKTLGMQLMNDIAREQMLTRSYYQLEII